MIIKKTKKNNSQISFHLIVEFIAVDLVMIDIYHYHSRTQFCVVLKVSTMKLLPLNKYPEQTKRYVRTYWVDN